MSSFPVARRFKRRQCETKAAVLCRGQFSFEASVDLSEGGMRLRSTTRYSVGDSLEINFVVPGGNYVSASARVVYARNDDSGYFSYGIEFVNPSPALKSEVRTFVEASV